MFERAPREPEWVSWLSVGVASVLLFALVPIARTLEGLVEGSLGKEAFLGLGIAALALTTGAVVRHLRAGPRVTPARAIVLLLVFCGYAGYGWVLRESPVEALHFVLYGVLGVLAFRALGHRTRDVSVYFGAALLGGSVGIVDEAIQWATPRRVWDLRDIGFNFIGASAVQLAIAFGFRPPWIASRASGAGIRRACRLAFVTVALLTASLLNTPARIAAYTVRVPALARLADHPDVMLEYGTLYEDPAIGRFRSRFPPESLAKTDRERGEEAGAVLAGFPGDAKAFLARYTAIRDPFLHEVRVHVFRRDRYMENAAARRPGSRKWREHLTVSYRENEILERYFPVTLRHSGARLSEAERAELAEQQDPSTRYESRVSEGLVTRFTERQVVLAAGCTLLVLAIASFGIGRGTRRGT